jgi:hypothetical protein
MFIFIFVDGKHYDLIYQAKVSFLDKTKHILSLYTIKNVIFSLYFHLLL